MTQSSRPAPASPPPSAHRPADSLPSSRLAALLRDFTGLMGQQMYFWGRDVLHPDGNLLCKAGLRKKESDGLKGTSCYRKRLDEFGFVELHGACAGYYEPTMESGRDFLFIRERKRCFLYSGDEPPAPGFYRSGTLDSGPAIDLYFASLRFLEWWLEYESWVLSEAGTAWRQRCFDAFASLPGSRPLLEPKEAVLWLNQYRRNPADVTRVRERMRARKG